MPCPFIHLAEHSTTAVRHYVCDRTNCGDCGVPTCFAFATAVAQGQRTIDRCPALAEGSAETFDDLLDCGEDEVDEQHEMLGCENLREGRRGEGCVGVFRIQLAQQCHHLAVILLPGCAYLYVGHGNIAGGSPATGRVARLSADRTPTIPASRRVPRLRAWMRLSA